VATCSLDWNVKLWNISNISNWTLIRSFTGHTNDVWAIEYINNDLFASGGHGGIINIRSTSSLTPIKTIVVGYTNVFCLKLLRNSNYLAAGLDNNFGILIYDFKNVSIMGSLNVSNCSGVYDLVQISSDLLASSSTDYNVRIWNLTTYSIKFTLSGHTLTVFGLELVSTEILASGSLDNTIKLWNILNGQLIKTLTGHTSSIQWSIDSMNLNTLISGSSDKTIKKWNVITGELMDTFDTGLQIRTLSVLNSYTSK
jgi:WD40 repeat protein